MRVFIIAASILLSLIGCKNDPKSDANTKVQGPLEYQCVLSTEGLMGVRPKQTIAKVQERFKAKLRQATQKIGDREITVYNLQASNGESAVIYPIRRDTAEVVRMVEYTGTLCKTDKQIGVSSRFEDIQKAYPAYEVHGSETEGRTIVSAGGWGFVLAIESFSYKVDVASIPPDTRVVAIILQ